MFLGVVIPVAVLGVVALLGIALVRGRDALDLSPRGLLRLYLYVASLAGVIVLAYGLASAGNAALATAFGNDLVYGSAPVLRAMPPCPPNTPECERARAEEIARRDGKSGDERDRRRSDDLIRGITFAAFGAMFWGAHRAARRGLGDDDAASAIRRGYLMLGTVVFGLGTIVLLPYGIYQALSHALLPGDAGMYRPGVSDSLTGGLVALPVWLLYLREATAELRRPPVTGDAI